MSGTGTDDDVEGRVVIVTGGGRGIGFGIARHLAAHGANVSIGELVPRRLERAIAELGAEHLGVPCDVRAQDDLGRLVAATVDRFGRVDALVSNAVGFSGPRPLADVTADDLDEVYTSGVRATLWGMQAVHPHMRDAGWGRIVNVASGAGVLGLAGFGAYNAAKEAIRALTRTAAREWAADGIVANCICPAAFEPRSGAGVSPFSERAYDMYFRRHPMGRAGDAEHDIAPAVRFLCSDASRFVNGETMMVDGGASMHA